MGHVERATPQTHSSEVLPPGLPHAPTITSLSCLRVPILSPSQAARGKGQPHGATSQVAGMVFVTRLQKHVVNINWTDLATVGPSVLPYISGPFPHPLNALHYLLCFI